MGMVNSPGFTVSGNAGVHPPKKRITLKLQCSKCGAKGTLRTTDQAAYIKRPSNCSTCHQGKMMPI